MKYFSIVRVRVLSESENRRFTSTDFDADLQAFKHEKSPMKSDFFGQISFLSPQYGADEGTRTHMVSHRNLKPARLPVSPHPHIFLLTFAVTPSAATPTTITFRHAGRRTLHNTHLTQHSTVIPHQTRSDRNQFHRRLFQLTVRTLDLPGRTAA